MDTLKILLGATVALLLGALAVSVKGFKRDMGSVPAEDVAAMKKELAAMKAEMRRYDELRERQRIQLQEEVAQPAAQDREAIEQRLREAEERAAEAERMAAEAEKDKEMAESEAGLLTQNHMEERNKSARRARVISDAMVIAVIKEWITNPELGSFAILDVRRPDNAQPGTVLAIRRNGGILGKLQVSDVSIEGTVASPTTLFNEAQPEPGDELILDEVVKLAN